MSENRVIGRGGEIPWRAPDDQKAVRSLTMGHCLLMGRKTWDTIRRPLPGRRTIVLTRDPSFDPDHDEVLVARSFDEALALAREQGEKEAFAFGGEAIYEAALARADTLHLTTIHAEVEGDAFFPEFEAGEWTCREESHHPADDRNEYAFTTRVLVRRGLSALAERLGGRASSTRRAPRVPPAPGRRARSSRPRARRPPSRR